MNRSQRLLGVLCSQPTLAGQIGNVIVAIATFSTIARLVSPADFGRYAAVAAAYAVVNGVVGAPLGARTIAQVGASEDLCVQFRPGRDFPATVGASLAVAAVAYAVGVSSAGIVWAAVGTFAWVVSEVAGGVALGAGRLWDWGALLVTRQLLSLGIILAFGFEAEQGGRLSLVFMAGGLAAVIPVVYIVVCARLRVGSWPFPMADLGSAQLALWVIAGADRIIFGHLDPVGAAAYAAAYSVIDRAFRTVASAELPRALSEEMGGSNRGSRLSIARPLIVVPAVVAAVVIGPTLVAVLTGGRYRPTYELIAVLACGMAMMTMAVPGYASLIAKGRIRLIGRGVVVIAVGNVVANFFVIPTFGGTGAAVVTLISYAGWLALVRGQVHARRRFERHNSPEIGSLAEGSA